MSYFRCLVSRVRKTALGLKNSQMIYNTATPFTKCKKSVYICTTNLTT